MSNRLRIRAVLGALPLVGGAVLFGTMDRPAIVEEAVAEVVSAVPNVPTTLVAAVRTSYPGFDTNIYPGDRAMHAWRQDSHYEWVGYYLPAPCHKDDSWSGKRAALDEMGWGLAVIYVGQQTWDRAPTRFETRYRTSTRKAFVTKRVQQSVRRNGKLVTRTVARRVPVTKTVRTPYRVEVNPASRPLDECSANLVSGTRGAMEAADAIERTRAEGFANGAVIFLDVERMEFTPQAMRDYYREWVRQVLADGTYRPGIYAHTHNAERIYKDVKAEFLAAGEINDPPFWIANGRGFTRDKEPHEAGHSFAAIWQGKLDTYESRNGVRLPIDVNVAAVKSPSTTDIALD
jgi:hypothetical protein